MKGRWDFVLWGWMLIAPLAMAARPAVVAESSALPDEVLIEGVEYVRIPAGLFWYSAGTEYANRRKFNAPAFRDVQIWLDEYYIGKYEVRARDFVRFMNSKAARQDWIGDPQYWLPEVDGCAVAYMPGQGFFERYPNRHYPATAVSWPLAQDFAQWMGARLPTDTEWQKAARGTDRRIWPWGNEHPDETFANHALGVHCAPSPIDGYPKGRSPFGVYNMAGNVAEWVVNWYNLEVDKGLRTGSRNPAPPVTPVTDDDVVQWPAKLVKGGRWGSVSGSVSIAWFELSRPGDMNSSSGVRFAMDAQRVKKRLQEGSAQVLVQRRGGS